MRIELNDQGAAVTTTITSTVFEFRRHNRAVDTAIFMSPGVRASSGGFFMLKTVISGKAIHVLRAYRTLQSEAIR